MFDELSPKIHRSRAQRLSEDGNLCSFGVTEAIALGLTTLGVGAETAGVLAPVLLGAGGGALTSGITGGNPLIGALGGGLTGGLISFAGPALGSALGIGGTAGDALVGAGTSAAFNAATGGNPLTGALTGGAAGLASGLTSGGGAATDAPGALSTAGAAGGAGASAAATAAPASVGSGFDAGAGGLDPATFAGVTDTAGLNLGTGTSPISSGGSGGGGSLGTSDLSINTSGGGSGGNNFFSNLFGGGSADLTTAAGTVGQPNAIGSQLASSSPLEINTSGTAGGSSGSDGGFLGGAGKYLGPAIAGGGVLMDLLKGNQTPPGYSNIQGNADQLATEGSQLQSYLKTGTLPPGVQQGVQQAGDSAKASIRSQYASLGMTGSSAENQALSSVANTQTQEATNIALQLMQQGVSDTQISSQLYEVLMQEALSQDQQLGSAIGSFASSLAGSAPSLRLSS